MEPESIVSRRTAIVAAAWTVPAVSVAIAAPAAAASTTNTWSVEVAVAEFRPEETPGNGLDGFVLIAYFYVQDADGGSLQPGDVTLTTDTGDFMSWNFGGGGNSLAHDFTFASPSLDSLNARSLRVTISGESYGPFPIDRSALASP